MTKEEKKEKEAEEEREMNVKRQQRIEREKQEHENRVSKNNAFVNDILDKKRNEQEMRNRVAKEKKKREEEQCKIYSNIDGLMNIDPKLAGAYVDVMANIKK